jgi:hypothetical protein
MPPYKELFPVGSRIRIAPRERLEQFQRTWKYHHPLSGEQILFAGHEATVRDVSYYHGGDVLHVLHEMPGTWHEECLSASEGDV